MKDSPTLFANSPNRRKLLEIFRHLSIWKRRGHRAPHKPLLLLLSLGRIQQGRERLASFADIGPVLSDLLLQFGPPTKTYHPEYPFWRLQNDGIWEVLADAPLTPRASNTDAKKSELLAKNAKGGFAQWAWKELDEDPAFLRDAATCLLDGHFPQSLHSSILSAVALELETPPGSPRRDPAFRLAVLDAYEHRCAVCGFSLRLRSKELCLEAAHIMWHAAGGPDVVQNALALCALHHQVFDAGAMTVSVDGRVLVSGQAHGEADAQDWLLKFHGRNLRTPHSQSLLPHGRYLQWHLREVFRRPSRD